MQNRQVSIGLPVYNGALFIRDALHSLGAQTFTDYELVISDNASSDETEVICREFAKRDSRIRYYRQESNRGSAENFQFVLDAASGDYFMWAAADDEWHSSFVEVCRDRLEHDPSIGFVVTKYAVVSRFCRLFSRRGIPSLDCVTEPDRELRVLSYSRMSFDSLKDNLAYGLWRREALVKILNDLRSSSLGRTLIGGAMNEYALSLYKGALVKSVLFRKRYRYLPPGHQLEAVAGIASAILRHFRGRKTNCGDAYSAAQHISDLEVVLRLVGYDQSYISTVLDANRYHIKNRKTQSS